MSAMRGVPVGANAVIDHWELPHVAMRDQSGERACDVPPPLFRSTHAITASHRKRWREPSSSTPAPHRNRRAAIDQWSLI